MGFQLAYYISIRILSVVLLLLASIMDGAEFHALVSILSSYNILKDLDLLFILFRYII